VGLKSCRGSSSETSSLASLFVTLWPLPLELARIAILPSFSLSLSLYSVCSLVLSPLPPLCPIPSPVPRSVSHLPPIRFLKLRHQGSRPLLRRTAATILRNWISSASKGPSDSIDATEWRITRKGFRSAGRCRVSEDLSRLQRTRGRPLLKSRRELRPYPAVLIRELTMAQALANGVSLIPEDGDRPRAERA